MENELESDQEAAGEAACYEAAANAGISPMQAERCDDGEYDCPECPWRRHNASLHSPEWSAAERRSK